jgi:hypothetical protein
MALHTEVTASLIVEERPAMDKVLLRALKQDDEDHVEDEALEGEALEERDIISASEEPVVREEIISPSLWDERWDE